MGLLTDLLKGTTILTEAEKEDNPDVDTKTPDNNDEKDQKDTTKDVEEDTAKTEEEPEPKDKTEEEDPNNLDEPTDAEPTDDTDATLTDTEEPVKPATKPDNKIPLSMSDPRKKLFIIERIEELSGGYNSIESLVNSIIVETSLSTVVMNLLRQLLNKIQFNQKYLKDILEDSYVDSIDVLSLKKLFELYYVDLTGCKDTLKIITKIKSDNIQ